MLTVTRHDARQPHDQGVATAAFGLHGAASDADWRHICGRQNLVELLPCSHPLPGIRLVDELLEWSVLLL